MIDIAIRIINILDYDSIVFTHFILCFVNLEFHSLYTDVAAASVLIHVEIPEETSEQSKCE